MLRVKHLCSVEIQARGPAALLFDWRFGTNFGTLLAGVLFYFQNIAKRIVVMRFMRQQNALRISLKTQEGIILALAKLFERRGERNMKIQRTVLLAILVVVGLVAASDVKTVAAAAAPTSYLYTCTVNYAGPVTSSGYKMAISLTYVSGVNGAPVPAKTTKVFYAPVGHEKEYLAVALAAIANGKTVFAQVDFDTTTTTVFNLYLSQ